MNILHVNASDISGGAARAAYRIHRSLVNHGAAHGLHSRMRVISKLTDDATVIGGPPTGQSRLWRKLQPRLAQHAQRRNPNYNPALHSIAWPATGLGRELHQRQQQDQVNLVHLHWLGDSTLSIEEIGRLPMPLVWTLHDQWAFCGTEHYTILPQLGESASSDERFVEGYTQTIRPNHEADRDINRRTWLRKLHSWCHPIQIICPTNWLADCARRSALMKHWPITVIPHPIDLQVWAPFDQRQARALLNLPADRPLVFFGADGGIQNPRKGADLLLHALQLFRMQVTDTVLEHAELVVFGQSEPVELPNMGFPIHFSGRMHDDLTLRLLYCAADVMVVPSRQETFGQTALEAHACGTPVVAFRTGGLIDIVSDRITGAIAEPFEPASLADAIRWVLVDSQRRQQLGKAARQRAEQLWNPALVVDAYAEAYRMAFNPE